MVLGHHGSIKSQLILFVCLAPTLVATQIILQHHLLFAESVIVLTICLLISALRVFLLIQINAIKGLAMMRYLYVTIIGWSIGGLEVSVVEHVLLQSVHLLVWLSEVLITLVFYCHYHDISRFSLEYRQTSLYRLTHQIHHHFLFNALNTTVCLIDERPLTASDNLIAIAKLYRMIMNQTAFSSLKQEIEISKLYVAIEQKRLDKPLKVSWKINDERIKDTKIPTLYLQPLIENAIHHGMERVSDEKCVITINIRSQNDQTILVEVINASGETSSPKRNGITHQNLKKRLELCYGKRNFRLVIKQELRTYIVRTIIPEEEYYELTVSR